MTRALRNLFQEVGDKEHAVTTLIPQSLTPSSPSFPRDVYLPDIQFFAARDRVGTAEGFYLAAKGGHNAESHNHNDVGHFIVYQDGKPSIIDIGVETYTRKTFSPQRYEIWTMQSAYHSLPTIDGVMQAPGRQFAARDATYQADEEIATFSLDLAAAYPPEAHLRAWQRTLTLVRGLRVELHDSYELTQLPTSLTLSLMTPCQVELSEPGQARLEATRLAGGRVSGAGVISYDPACLSPTVETIPIADPRLLGIWGPELRRLVFTAVNPGLQGEWRLQVVG